MFQIVTLDDLTHVAVLGAGAFGRVTLVRYDGRTYALKAMSKAHVVRTGLTEHVKRERDTMKVRAHGMLFQHTRLHVHALLCMLCALVCIGVHSFCLCM